MLSDRTLERVSMSYARGYRDGYAGSPKDVPDCGISQKDIDNCLAPEPMRPFADEEDQL